MYSLLLAIIYLAFIGLGLPDSLLGSAWPVMHETLGVPVSFMGIIGVVTSGCTIISSLASDKLTRRFGTPAVVTVSTALTAVALFGFSVSRSFWLLIVISVPYGLGAGAIDAALNNYVAQHYKSKHMSWLHCFWGVGTIVSPFIMSYALTNSSWPDGYANVGIMQLVIVALLVITLPVWKINAKGWNEGEQKSIGLFGALKIRGVPTLLLGFFAYCSAEATVMVWASTYMVEVKSLDAPLAAQLASLFYIGMTVGRFLGGFLMTRLCDRKMIILGTGVLTVGIAMLLLPVSSDLLSFVGFVVIGLGCAPIYPCIIHSTPESFGAENSGAIIGIQMASAYLGSTVMPAVFGFLGAWVGYWVLPVYLLVFIALMAVMIERTFKLTSKSKEQLNK